MGARRINWKQIFKVLIAAAVLVGLFFAGHKALHQWSEQTERLRSEADGVQNEMSRTSDPDQLAALKAQRAAILKGIPSIANLDWTLIVLAAFVYAMALIPPGIVLSEAVRTFGERASTSRVIAAQLLGHLGKYVPGKAMVVVLRAGVMRGDGVSLLPATISVFMETLLMMGVGAALAGVVTCMLPVPKWMMYSAIGIAVLASLPTLPPILRRVALKFAPKENLDSNDPEDSMNTGELVGASRFFLVGWVWSLLSWILVGAAFTLLVAAIPSSVESPSWHQLAAASTAAIALAMVIGFASLLPGGAGVRELVLMTLLSPMVGTAHALFSAIAVRLLFIVVEVVCAACAWILLGKNRSEV